MTTPPYTITDSAILRAAPDNSDDWDDRTWAAWARAADKAHNAKRPDDEQIESLADTLYDALYAITPYAEPYFADETAGLKNAVRAVLAEARKLNANPSGAPRG
ncbi:hypothetical protein ACFU98_29815 [Streptomyces sp. NPDC057575]|uniref:hypothetical protein n=1 Tax=unclassified Streptomyces TaxID=2593676 RepID=UPI00368FF6F1